MPELPLTAVPRVAPIAREIIDPPPKPPVAPQVMPAALPPKPITLELLSPMDGSGVEVGATRVMGTTSADSIAINGMPVEVAADGSFQRDILLQEGVNLLEVVASTRLGPAKSEQIVVFVVSPVAALPFSLLYPTDGLIATEPTIRVVGVTRPDALVGVNGIPVEVNALGIFSTTLSLEEGDNLIEVVATDLREVRFQTVAVFYTP